MASSLSLPGISQASALCDSLLAQLANTAEVYGATDQTRKYDAAIKAQSDQIRTAEYDMKRLGCSQGSVIVYGGANSIVCEKLTKTLGHMQDNLEQLTTTKATLVSGNGDDSHRQELMQAYKDNNCSDDVSEAEASVQTISVASTGMDDVYSPSVTEVPTASLQEDPAPQPKQTMIVVPLGSASETGTLKTLCVRTCDGGFFPISQGAAPKDFRRDARVCSMMCPGTETELFYNDNASDKPEEMVSTTSGQTYSELPKAFAYRLKPGSGGAKCGCNFSAYYKEMIRREAELNKSSKPLANTLQQSMASSDMRTEMQNSPSASTPNTANRNANTIRKVRQVGPVFLQDDSAAIDLKHPGKNKLN